MSTCAPLKGDGHGRYCIQVVGNSGVGKVASAPLTAFAREQSTFAAQLSEILCIPHISLDALFWLPNWGSMPIDEFKVKVQTALDQDERGWIVDGSYNGKLGDLVGRQATDTIWLDPPFMLYFPRLCIRTFLRLFNFRPPCSPDCDETWSDVFTMGEKSIIWWCWTNHEVVRQRQTIELAEGRGNRLRIGGWGSELNELLEGVGRMVHDA